MLNDQSTEAGHSAEMAALEEMGRSNSEAFSILGTELAEVKAMLMVLLDLQKSTILASGMSENDLEAHVRTLLEGYRERFLSQLSGRVQQAADKS